MYRVYENKSYWTVSNKTEALELQRELIRDNRKSYISYVSKATLEKEQEQLNKAKVSFNGVYAI